MATQSDEQKEVMERVMHEYAHGELKTSTGAPVRNRRQAIAIALSEAGDSSRQSPAENRARLEKTKAREAEADSRQTKAAL